MTRMPPIIRALDLFLKESGENTGAHQLKASIVGEGYLVGKPVSHYLKTKNYIVEVLTDYKKGQKIQADFLALSAGVPGLVRGEDISTGCNVVDFGTTIVDGKTYGDLEKETEMSHLGLVSMSPGGMGPLVVRFLVMNFLGI
jgi:methylenetetrahydrofolate dehydrogenase (NADP+)/methenyltetrahydrofolate cyclohydrolase